MDERFRRALEAAGWTADSKLASRVGTLNGHTNIDIATLDALLALCRAYAGEWQPIETAPRDGTPIIAFMPTYYQERGGQAIVVYMDWNDRPGWYSHVTSKHDPTHWRPLPEPPHD